MSPWMLVYSIERLKQFSKNKKRKNDGSNDNDLAAKVRSLFYYISSFPYNILHRSEGKLKKKEAWLQEVQADQERGMNPFSRVFKRPILPQKPMLPKKTVTRRVQGNWH